MYSVSLSLLFSVVSMDSLRTPDSRPIAVALLLGGFHLSITFFRKKTTEIFTYSDEKAWSTNGCHHK